MRQIGLITVSVTTSSGELTSNGLYTYTRQGKPLSKNVTLDDNQCNYNHTIEYDSGGFMKKETVSSPYIGFHNQRTAVEYNYNSLGQIASRYFDIRTTVEYEYNLRGQLTSIQSPFFSQNIKYETGTTPCYNGNISEYTVSYNGGEAVRRTFSYDRMNRLTAMSSSDGFNTAYTYNINSAPLTIQRYGLTSDGTVGLIDDLTMTYSGNQLTRVTDSADPVILENSSDFNAADGRYTYDADGRLIADTERGITNIEYSPIGKPLKITTATDTLTFAHYADGTKRQKTYAYTLKGQPRRESWFYEDVFEFKSWNGSPTKNIEFLHLPWGYINGMDVHVYIQDYQGNNRVVVDQMRQDVQTTDYYPYGMPMATSTGASYNAYKYSGKEFETRMGLNQYDYHARLQIPSIAMFNQPDPKADAYNWLNPYLYCTANPIANIDPTGNDWYSVYDDETKAYVYNYTSATSQEELDKLGIQGRYLGNIVVVINGSMGEKLGKGDNLNGEGAVLAQVKVFGPNGEDDTAEYRGFTMTSNYEKFGAIADGEYPVTYKTPGKSGTIKSNYAVNNGEAVDCINGKNPSPKEYNPCSPTQKNGIYIHRSNWSGYAGDDPIAKQAVSTGCILIHPKDWPKFCNQIGANNFLMILNRTQ